VAAPYVRKAGEHTRLSRQVVWLPEGDWFDFFSGEHFAGDGWHALYGRLRDIPVFARAGAILPMAPKTGWGGLENPEALDLHVFAGAGNRFTLYEDDGDSTAYLQGTYCLTSFEQEWRGDRLVVSISPGEGDRSLVPARRAYRVIIKGVRKVDGFAATVNGAPVELSYSYDAALETMTCSGLAISPADSATVTLDVRSGSLLGMRDRTAEKVSAMLRAFDLETRAKHGIDAGLPALMADINKLADFWVDLKDEQAIALAEVIQKTALDREPRQAG
jgi:hypothetical protein